MAFTSWETLKTDILDAIANHISGSPCVGEYEVSTASGSRRMKYNSIEDLKALYEWACTNAAKSTGPRRSFGRYRRF